MRLLTATCLTMVVCVAAACGDSETEEEPATGGSAGSGGTGGSGGIAASGGTGAVAAAGGGGTGPSVPAVVDVQVGGDYSCSLHEDGSVRCWGDPDDHLGSCAVVRPQPTVVTGLVDPQRLAIGAGHACALLQDTTVSCWGFNDQGQLGRGVEDDDSHPPDAVPGLTGVTDIAAGQQSTCVVMSDASAQCWGRLYGSSPATVADLADVVEVRPGESHLCARHTNGTVSCGGRNFEGQLGLGTVSASEPETLVPTVSGATQLAIGYDWSCALLTSGIVSCWGDNFGGKLGRGFSDENPHPNPTMVPTLTEVTWLAAGNWATFAARSSGTVWGWGDQPFEMQGSAEPIDGFANVQRVTVGYGHGCALTNGGEVWCLGFNNCGQLGHTEDGTTPLPVEW